jgi:hypothetical protein
MGARWPESLRERCDRLEAAGESIGADSNAAVRRIIADRHARSAVMSISIQPWHGPREMSVCMTPLSVPLA